MKSSFCILKRDLKNLWTKKQKTRLLECLNIFKGKFTLPEMLDQMREDRGAFGQAIADSTLKFSKNTKNVEIAVAIDLADFYLPGIEAEICFGVKRMPNAIPDFSYDDIEENIDGDTYIDCSLKSNERQFNFQIKRYPQFSHAYTNEAINNYIEETIDSYGNMKGTILIILLQPNSESQNDFSFSKIYEYILTIKEKISFDEINFIFNYRNQKKSLLKIFPFFKVTNKPLELLSDKYQRF